MTGVRVVDTPLEYSTLVASALNGRVPADWFARAPASVSDWTARCIQLSAERRTWLAPIRPAFGSGAVLLDRVADGKGVVVTTGQQAGLFGGPLYTVIKALGALELARALERETGVPAVPVFWAATDDADFLEACSTVVATADGAERLMLLAKPADGVPMSHARLGDEVTVLLDRLRGAAASPGDERPMRAAEAFRPGATMGGAYVEMLRQLLEPLGMAVLDSSHAAVGDASRATLASALVNANDVHAALLARQAAFSTSDFESPVRVERELSLVFAWERAADGLPHKRRLSIAEAAHANGNLRLSPNVLLRPAVERSLLPTVAYLAGPSELAYFGQTSAVAGALGMAAPLAVPRWSGMLIPDEITAALDQLHLAPDALRDPHAAEKHVARAALPAAAVAALSDLRSAIARDVGQLEGLLTPEALDGARGQFTLRADRLERRLLASVKRREAPAMRAVAAARGMLYPFGKAQERVLNAMPFLARYGDALVKDIRTACAAHAGRLIANGP